MTTEPAIGLPQSLHLILQPLTYICISMYTLKQD